MTFHAFLDAETPLLGCSTAVIKARHRQDFEEAAALLAEVRAMKARTEAQVSALREQAQSDGFRAGFDQAKAAMADRLAELAQAFDTLSETRRAETAQAAFAAFKAILGAMETPDVTARLAEAALARLPGEGPATIEVAPAMAEAVTARTGNRPHVVVRANPAFGPLDCEIQSPQGRVVASLDVQLAALAARWGVEGDPA